MATAAKRWPNNAEWARMDCITLARQGRKFLDETLDQVSDPIVLRGMARAIDAFREIEFKLLSVGAKAESNAIRQDKEETNTCSY